MIPAQTNGSPSGWQARIAPFEMPPNPAPGMPIVDRIEVQVWWMNGDAASAPSRSKDFGGII